MKRTLTKHYKPKNKTKTKQNKTKQSKQIFKLIKQTNQTIKLSNYESKFLHFLIQDYSINFLHNNTCIIIQVDLYQFNIGKSI